MLGQDESQRGAGDDLAPGTLNSILNQAGLK